MGYIKHDCAVAIGFDPFDDEKKPKFSTKMKAFQKRVKKEFGPIVLGPYGGINGTITFFFAPDGSKEGWDASSKADTLRSEFVELAEKLHAEVLQVRFGGDDSLFSAKIGRQRISAGEQN